MTTETVSADTEAAAPFDFGLFEDCVKAQEAGREIEIRTPDGKNTNVFFTIYGMESTHYRASLEYAEKKEMEDRKLGPETGEDRLKFQTRLYAGCVKSWRTGAEQVLIFRGKKYDPTRSNIEMILSLSMQVRAQVVGEVNSAAGFLKG